MSLISLHPNQMTPVETIDWCLDPAPHPFERAHRDEIDAHWITEKAAQPALFNGRMLMFSTIGLDGKSLGGTCHFVDFATLLYWRTLRPHPGITHAFGHAALVSSDGALIAVKMSAHTANPGKVYFAAGSLENEDLRGNAVDLDANMRREVREETGLDLSAYGCEPVYHALATSEGTVVFRRYRLGISADEAAELIAAHVNTDPEPEITGAVVLREGEPHREGLLPHMQAFCEWHFAHPMSVEPAVIHDAAHQSD